MQMNGNLFDKRIIQGKKKLQGKSILPIFMINLKDVIITPFEWLSFLSFNIQK